jgi:hypothetical protein
MKAEQYICERARCKAGMYIHKISNWIGLYRNSVEMYNIYSEKRNERKAAFYQQQAEVYENALSIFGASGKVVNV